MELKFNQNKKWRLPIPSLDTSTKPSFREVTQVKFYNEYFPLSHKIYNPAWYGDIIIYDEKRKKIVDTHMVNRVSVPVQWMSIDIILAHLLGNKTYLSDGTLKDNKALPFYKEYWETRNIDTLRYELFKSTLSLADGAALFYKEGGELKHQVLSMFNDDVFNMEYDKYGKPLRFYKYYDNKVDVYDKEDCSTYELKDKWALTGRAPHGFKGMPVAYHMRRQGAFWTPAQTNIEELEKMLSRLSEDNRSKFKSLYHLQTDRPDDVKTESTGIADMIITDKDGDFKLISGAEMSEQFKFEYETQIELIFNTLGIVFPKHKSSGDMPTGSMKMMFYPSERVVMSLIHEYDPVIDQINDIVKQGFVHEHPEHLKDVTEGNIRASIKMFTPQDDGSKVESIAKLKKEGIISGETAAEESPYTANNESSRIEKERQAELAREKEIQNLRLL